MSKPTYLVFDTETTGVDVFNDRIVQLVVAVTDEDGSVLNHQEWVINPGVEVPQGAIDVHGFSNEYLAANGIEPHRAFWEADLAFKAAVRDGLTFVAYNLNFDLSILTAEMARNSLGSRYGLWIADNVPLFDPLVVDRGKDRYRKGKRKLLNVAEHYGVPYDESKLHNALYDVEITAKVAANVAAKYGVPSNAEQAEMYKSWAENFQEFLRRSDPDARVSPDWPVKKEEA